MASTNVFIDKKPRWFDIKKYLSMGELTSQDWAYQLEIRSILSHWSTAGKPLDQWPDLYQQLFKDVQANPILATPDGYRSISPYRSLTEALHITGEYSGLHQDFVAPFTLGEAIGAIKQLPKEIIEILEKENEKYPEYSEIPLEFYGYKYNDEIVNEIHLKVDLGSSNENILRDFKKYLAAARSVYQNPKDGKITHNEILRLNQNKILPYLDLSIWSKVNGKKITYQNFANWLFTNKRDHISGEKIRKVTRPLALRAIEYQFVQKLNSFPE